MGVANLRTNIIIAMQHNEETEVPKLVRRSKEREALVLAEYIDYDYDGEIYDTAKGKLT